MASGTTLRTARLLLRPMRASDRDEYVRVHEVSRAHFAPWFPSRPSGPPIAAHFARELDRWQAEERAGTGVRRAAVLPDGRIAGFFSLNQIMRGAFLNAYAGWSVSADQVGRGLATEAVLGLLDLAFGPEPAGLGLHRVQANIIPANAPSVRVAQKAGFRLEGRAKSYLEIAGAWRDHLMFAKLAEEHALGGAAPVARRST